MIRPHFLRQLQLAQIFLTMAMVISAGCSKGPTHHDVVPVSGTVFYNGSAVEGAIVAFRGDGQGKPATGVTDASGRFQLTSYEEGDGAVPGRHIVTVTKYAGGQAPDIADTSMEAAAERPVEAATTQPEAVVPARYADPEQSGLEQTVEAGKPNDFKIELTD